MGSLIARQRINSLANSLSPLKWTNSFMESSLDDFSCETVADSHWRVFAIGAISQIKQTSTSQISLNLGYHAKLP